MHANNRKLSIIVLMAFLTACGGGGGGGSSAASGFSQSYTTSAGIGELMTYNINTSNLTYSYTITQSSYGLNGQTGSGTLSKNSDGSYSPSESAGSRVYALQNGLMIGAVSLNVAGTATTVPIYGISNPVTTLTSLAGTYNYVSKACSLPNGASNCANTSYGTLKIDNAGNYTQCTTTNITTSPLCNTTTGIITATGTTGVWSYVRTGSTNNNYLLAFTAPNGQNVLVVDLNDAGGYGYGQVVASTQATVNSGDADGVYTFLSNGGIAGSTTVTGTSFTSNYVYNGTAGSNNGTVVFNSPWTGLANVGGGAGTAMFAGTGVYAYSDNNAAHHYFEIGMRH